MANLKPLKKSRKFNHLVTHMPKPKGDSLDYLLKDAVFFCLKDSKVIWEFTAVERKGVR